MPLRFPRLSARQWVGYFGIGFLLLLAAAVAIWRGDILRAALDPQIPFQTYRPPPPPDYSRPDAWALSEARAPGTGPAAVFFVHSTTYDGGSEWNGPIGDARSDAYLRRVVLPNHAGPFARAGAVSAPRYRQASLYARLTLREDAREARAFAYRDVEKAFVTWLARHPSGPIILVGAEQGADLIDRLLHDHIAPDAALRRRLVGAYLMDGLIPESRFTQIPLCGHRDQAGCVVAWRAVREGDEGEARRLRRRALMWDQRGMLVGVQGDRFACVNPVTGSHGRPSASERDSLGATNATKLEWGTRPALQGRIVSAACRDGFLWRSRPQSESLRDSASWTESRKIPAYNLFYADVEADVLARLRAWELLNDQ